MADERYRTKVASRIDYQKLINCYQSLFADVLVLPFELLVDDEQLFVEKICDFLGISPFLIPVNARSNPAIPFVVQEIMRRTNIIDLHLWPQQRYIARAFRAILNRVHLNLDKMEKPEIRVYKPYDEFKILNKYNYEFWAGDLSKYNYTFDE